MNDPVADIDIRLLQALAESIKTANEINPNSWAINQIRSGTVVLWVESIWVMAVRQGGGDIVLLGDPNDEALHAISDHIHPADYRYFDGFQLRNLSADQFQAVFSDLGSSHRAAVIDRAKAVKTRTQRGNDHNAEVLDLLASRLGENLPQPGYEVDRGTTLPSITKKYRSRNQPVTGYWKQTVSEEQWEDWRTRGILTSTLWNDPAEDLRAWPSDRREFTKKAEQREGISDGTSHRLWMFTKGMRPGDKILVHAAMDRILGAGIVISDYEFVEGQHQRQVQWTSTKAIPIGNTLISDVTSGQNLWGLTPIDLSAYNSIAGALELPDYDPNLESPVSRLSRTDDVAASGNDLVAGQVTPTHVPTTHLLSMFGQAGLRYTLDQIANFYTALQTKGFVVLSGISGTGKSKIAQHFVEMLPGQETHTAVDGKHSMAPMLTFTMSSTQNWAAISANQSDLFPPIDENVRQPVIFGYQESMSKGYVILRTLAQGKPTLYLTLGRDLSSTLRQAGAEKRFYASFELDDAARSVERIRIYDRPISIEAIDDPDLPDETKTTNSLFLSVRPDWRDSTSLLGYYNPLTETYEWTEFLRFILRAAESYRNRDGLAWFVILDEMNLAHVEYYFADLLSIIESGRDEEGWSREPIRLTYPDGKTDNPPPHEIKLPPNLYIIGTVNMDETTHAFSPKVLDRAFTIELTEVDFSDYPPAQVNVGPGLPENERQALLTAFTRNGTFAQINKDDIRAIVDRHIEIRDWLQRLNVELAAHQFQFGYRVFDEIAQFVHNAEENGMFDDPDGADNAWIRAFDHAVYMKVLPKFNGSHARLDGPLNALLAWAKNPAGEPASPDPVVDDDMEAPVSVPPAVRLDRVATRAERMLELLEANGFVSFG